MKIDDYFQCISFKIVLTHLNGQSEYLILNNGFTSSDWISEENFSREHVDALIPNDIGKKSFVRITFRANWTKWDSKGSVARARCHKILSDYIKELMEKLNA